MNNPKLGKFIIKASIAGVFLMSLLISGAVIGAIVSLVH